MARTKSNTKKRASATPYTDRFVDTTVDWQYRSRYDPEFRAKLNAAVFFVVGLIAAVAFTVRDPKWGWVSLIAVPFVTVIIYYMSRWFAKYDIQSTRAYCMRVLPKNASENKIRECVENRENLEDLGGGYGGYGG